MIDSHTLKGKTALVTGGGQRLGRAISLGLAATGANVAVHYRASREAAEATVADARALGVNAWAAQADLEKNGGADSLFEEVLRLAGPVTGSIDLLVNNASKFPVQGFNDLNENTLLENLRLNSLAPLALARALKAQGRESGAVVNLLDTRIQDYDSLHVPYHLSKRMLFDLTKIMALEFAPHMRVNAVAPGLILPPQGKDMQYLEKLSGELPLKKHGNVKDVSDAVLFLLSSPFITGQVIFVDGGRHLRTDLYG